MKVKVAKGVMFEGHIVYPIEYPWRVECKNQQCKYVMWVYSWERAFALAFNHATKMKIYKW